MPGPGERASAFGADAAIPATVVELAERGQHFGARVAVHVDDAGEVFHYEDAAAFRKLSQQAASRILRAFLFPGPGEQGGGTADGGFKDDVGHRRERRDAFGLTDARPADEHEPHGVAPKARDA